MYKCERQNEILSLLTATGYATVEYLARKLSISPSSIRRDLQNLEQRGAVERSYGGVRLSDAGGKQIPFSLRSKESYAQKTKIAEWALSLVHSGDTVMLDGSSSALFLARLLPSLTGITVISNSVDVCEVLKNTNVKVYSTGGKLSDENRPVLVGGFTEDFVRRVRADILFFSVQGVDSEGVMYDCYAEEIAVRRVMFSACKTKVLLCDHSKLARPSTFVQGTLDDVDVFLTDVDPGGFFSVPLGEKIRFPEA